MTVSECVVIEREQLNPKGVLKIVKDRCIRMLKPHIPNQPATPNQKQQCADDSQMVGGGILTDLPLYSQVQRVIHLSGHVGVTNSSIRKSLNNFNKKILESLMVKISDPKAKSKGFQCIKISESFGREKRFRYFSKIALDSPIGHVSEQAIISSPIHDPTSEIAAVIEPLPLMSSREQIRSLSDQYNRRSNFLKIMDDLEIVEYGKNLATLLKDFSELERLSPFVIDKRTIARIAEALEVKGKLKISSVSLPIQNGKLVHRTFYHLPSIATTSKKFKDFIRQLRESQYANSNKSSFTRHSTILIEGEVDRLDAIARKVGSRSSLNHGIITPPLFSSPVQALNDEPSSSPWLNVALDYGYVSGKYARASLLHSAITGMLLSTDGQKLFKNSGKFHAGLIYKELPLGIYLKLVSISNRCDDLDNFIQNNPDEYEDIQIHNLPSPVGIYISNRIVKFKSSISRLLDVLEALQLIIPLDCDQSDRKSLNKIFILSSHCPLYDYKLPTRPFIKYLSMRSHRESEIYWDQLRIISLHAEREEEDENLENDDIEEKLPRDETLRFITSYRNWNTIVSLASYQKDILNGLVDSVTGATPINNPEELLNISKATNLSVIKLKMFFRRSMQRNAKKIENHRIKTVESQFFSRKIIPRNMKDPSRKNKQRKEKQEIRNKMILADDFNIDDPSEILNDRMSKVVQRFKSIPFTKNEQEICILAYTIVKATRMQNGRALSWFPIINALGKPWKSHILKSRMNTLENNPLTGNRMKSLLSLWTLFMSTNLDRFGDRCELFNLRIESKECEILDEINELRQIEMNRLNYEHMQEEEIMCFKLPSIQELLRDYDVIEVATIKDEAVQPSIALTNLPCAERRKPQKIDVVIAAIKV